jgi:tellurite methyltransferase
MTRTDSIRWNARYQTASSNWSLSPRSILTSHRDLLNPPGLALDIAMGLGPNAEFLVKTGWRVIGVDIADAAVFAAHARCPQIRAIIADLEHFWLPADHFDLILNLYYLDRALWPVYRRAVKPGGLLIFETLMDEMRSDRPEIEPHFLLKAGELRAAFGDWQIITYHEGWVESDHHNQKAVASLIARRP